MNQKKKLVVFIFLVVSILFICQLAIGRSPTNKPFARKDLNNDGKLSRSEFMGTSKTFNIIDADGNGYITKREMVSFRLGKTKKQTTAKESTKVAEPTTDLVYIDTHAHLIANFKKSGRTDCEGAAKTALNEMNKLGVKKMLLMPMPAEKTHNETLTCPDLTVLTKKYPDRFGLMMGGGTLNPMIIESAMDYSKITDSYKDKFRKKALEVLTKKGVLGFGEMAAEHFSMNANHHYSKASPDHPLFLLLADIAAEKNVPIDLHMEAISQDIDLPSWLQKRKFNNPNKFKANIPAFEKLLAHNRKAKIVWVHLGWDNTRERTPELTERLLKAHPNLYMSFRVVKNPGQVNRPVDNQGNLKPDWLAVIKAYPDRFLFGCDEFFFPSYMNKEHGSKGSLENTVAFLKKLPDDLRKKVGYENAMQVYGIK